MLPHFGQGTDEDKGLFFIASIDELSIANVLATSSSSAMESVGALSSSAIVSVAVSSEKVEFVAFGSVKNHIKGESVEKNSDL